MHGGHVVAPISAMPYQMTVILGGLGVDMGWLLGASCVTDWLPLGAPTTASSLIFCCPCAIMPRRRVCAKEQSLSRRVFAILLSWMRAFLFVSCVFWPLVARLGAVEGRALTRADEMSVAVSRRVVPAWPM